MQWVQGEERTGSSEDKSKFLNIWARKAVADSKEKNERKRARARERERERYAVVRS